MHKRRASQSHRAHPPPDFRIIRQHGLHRPRIPTALIRQRMRPEFEPGQPTLPKDRPCASNEQANPITPSLLQNSRQFDNTASTDPISLQPELGTECDQNLNRDKYLTKVH
ncbi:hypothetical protein Pan216_11130 [Planctomycetes bacterium Pan216]|uniref:Uncharacterized protein n=1 Tax=Kolteria novifilia TaxID=2527975 RepID=A0A518AZZ8_9BACT|nr:hypothetical protein Pan216_11130 [Planctomycetes bacterium Pan216]